MMLRSFPSLPTWSKGFRELDDMRRDMERMFNAWTGSSGPRAAGVFTAINVTEDAESLYVRAELPGIDSKELDIRIEHDTLSIAGEREMPAETESASYHRREREWGAFRRSFTLNTRVDADKVQARYVDGILTVVLPKAAEARPKQITVQAGA